MQSRSPVEVETLAPVRRERSLQRSKSALPGITLPPISTLTAHLPPQLARGRSRDPHAWESCCQADFRDDLTKLAENESSGSAVAAISLLRSSSSSASLSNLASSQSASETSPLAAAGSNGGVLRSNSNKRNAQAAKNAAREDSAKKPRLGRTQSSIGRLQSLSTENGNLADGVAESDNKKPVASKGSLSTILSPSGGDSDKENWSPDEDGNPTRRHNNPSPITGTPSKIGSPILAPSKTNIRRAGRVLGEQNTNTKRSSLLLGSRANTAPTGVSQRRNGKALLADAPSLNIFEDVESRDSNGNDDKENQATRLRKEPGGGRKREVDVDRFMRGADVSPSKKPDMDCIAGLLSLSQGNWR